ncbi:MAG TPA: FtsX-like permease family protein, partial [Puia sp.]|nr:FtsX-like permease family protein [Puia sp.]
SAPLTQSWSDGWGQDWDGKDPSDRTDFRRYNEDGGLGKTAGLTFVAGRDIDPSTYPADSLAMVINESSLKIMKFKNPIGQIVKDNGKTWHVVGVIKDFILESPYEPTKPMLIYGPKAWFNIILVKLNNQKSISQYMEMMQKLVTRYDPNYLFVNNFVDEEYVKKFENEKRTGTLSGLFAGLTIFISCLGLLGLATYMAAARIKEIGVRKVLGASITNIVTLLSKDFIILVLISLLLATPIAWLAMYAWLQGYPYRIGISVLVFIGAGLVAILIAIITVSFQAIKAAMANPVKSLRTE